MGKINLVYWDSENFGDALSPLLIEELSGLQAQHKLSPLSKYNIKVFLKQLSKYEFHRLTSLLFPWQKTLLCIGSIMSWGKKNSDIWGAGFMNRNDAFKGGRTHAVRGKLTDEKLRREGFPGCAIYGDPALLLPLWIEPKGDKSYQLGIIPHWHEVDFFKEHYGKQYHIVDLRTRDVDRIVKQIMACEYILSTSLHGVIVGHAYHIPSLWIKKGAIDTDGFKFQDYFSSVNIAAYDGFENFDEILKDEKKWKALFREHQDKTLMNTSLAKMQSDLLRSAPFPIKEKYKNRIL
jgi:pyruvyltransferase